MSDIPVNEHQVIRLADFFTSWRNITSGQTKSGSMADFVRLSEFLAGYQSFIEKQEVIALEEAPAFNVFNLFRSTKDEISNSTFIANLLDPSGTHGQGVLFIQKFFQHLAANFNIPFATPNEFERAGWQVHTEFAISSGRCDVVIMNAHVGILCVIENKVYANEQDEQLQRYWNWMRDDHRIMEYPYQLLIFLTPRGRSSATLEADNYISLSYHLDITAWLLECLPAIQAAGVKEVVHQYIHTINKF